MGVEQCLLKSSNSAIDPPVLPFHNFRQLLYRNSRTTQYSPYLSILRFTFSCFFPEPLALSIVTEVRSLSVKVEESRGQAAPTEVPQYGTEGAFRIFSQSLQSDSIPAVFSLERGNTGRWSKFRIDVQDKTTTLQFLSPCTNIQKLTCWCFFVIKRNFQRSTYSRTPPAAAFFVWLSASHSLSAFVRLEKVVSGLEMFILRSDMQVRLWH